MVPRRGVWLLVVCALKVASAEDFDEEDFGLEGEGSSEYGYGGGGGYGGGDEDEYGGDPSPAFEVVEDLEALEAFVAQDELEPAVVGFFDPDRDAAAMATFQEVAEKDRYDFRFALTTDEEVRTGMKYAKSAVVSVYLPPRFVSPKYDKPKARYPSSKLDADALTKFVYKKSLPLVGQKTWKSGDRYDKAGVPILTLFASIDLEKNPKGFDYFANRLRKVAADYVGKMVFNIGDKDDFSYSLADYDLALETKKDIGVGVKHGDKHYKMTDKFNVDNVRAFVEAVLAGELTPKIKVANTDYDDDDEDEEGSSSDSGGGPMYGDSSPVVSLTSDTFEAETKDKDAFLEFYAPWCGHCQQLKPTYTSLAEKLKPYSENVIVAAMDATAHDPPAGFDVAGYPTILFKPKGADPIPYEDDRHVDAMLEFATKHASFALPSKDEL
eukprot:CAMPEP_0118899292 /NCGR_PEP_ID=MMETSP1166-20130328/5913_1 /TAXON_ID=1104430 /ORGANISM="Chrysoreinhardia sp, Strain CCMP3193" /LENGTH=438 /DNA_ID=CAMNT_0006838417 /DNA_START=58 /DNA_END=1374 /DNA_ORIENTATION=-